ncbi:hypothetical protein [Catenulispora subtropica]|uniref:hypothetical protein n=1 Tax=Catenulispora subtropica TaxID=450798 RepID=UPI0031DF845F
MPPTLDGETVFQLYRDDFEHTRGAGRIPLHPNFASAAAAHYADAPDPATRPLISFVPDAPVGTVSRLLKDPDPQMRRRIAKHPALPVELILECCEDPDLATAVLWNPSLPAEVMHKVLDEVGVPRCPEG